MILPPPPSPVHCFYMWSLIISIDFNNLNFGYTVCFMCCLNGRRFASGQSIENCRYEMFHNLMLSWKLVSKTSKNPFLVYGLVNCCARLSKYLCNILLFGLSYHLQRGSFICFLQMVVRAVSAVLTAEEQVMNPSLYPRQRRTRPGIVTFFL